MEKVIGVNPVLEILKNKEKTIEKLEIYKGVRGELLQKMQHLASERNIKIFYTNHKLENSQGFCLYVSDYDYYMDLGELLENAMKKETSILLILDEIQDPRNFGAIIRSAEAFGVEGIIIPERNSVRINETVVKTSTGAIEHVPIVKVTNLADTMSRLKKLDYWIYGAAGEATLPYYEEKYPQKVALILGNEGVGLRKKVREHCDTLIKIPMKGRMNSLNVSVAGGILLAEISKLQLGK